MKFHHVGIACDSIEEACLFVESLFPITHKSPIIFDPHQNANLCILQTQDGSRIEFVAGPMVSGFVKKNQYLYHTCWEVADIELAIEDFINEGATLISAPKEALLFDNRLVAFLLTPLGILELLQAKL